jgi:hypothetical protein
MAGEIFRQRTVGELARSNTRLVPVLAELGIGPRYLYWRLCDAVGELQLDLRDVLRRLEAADPGAVAA